jgi:hypothetical protein
VLKAAEEYERNIVTRMVGNIAQKRMTTVLHGALLLIVVDALVITLVVDAAAIVGWLKTRWR